MTQKISPFIESKYGWDYGESGWNTGMDENIVKFSFLFDKNIDGIVSSLPAAEQGKAYFLTTDNRVYFSINNTWFSSQTPKWFTLRVRGSGDSYEFDGVALVALQNSSQLNTRLDSVEVVVNSLGTAAYVDTNDLASQADLEVVLSESSAYTNLSISQMPLYFFAPSSSSDRTADVIAFFTKAFNEQRSWVIPQGDFVINPSAPISIKTSGNCHGRFLVPKANQTFRFDVIRDSSGTVISTTGWANINRGDSDVNAINAVGKNLFLSSSEVLIERIGSGGASYLKQEFIRCTLPTGSFSTPAVCTYNSLANLTVTAYTPSLPITVSGLNILLTGNSGGVESNRGIIAISRDNVILNQACVINQLPAQPKPVAIEVGYCADVVINSPTISGFNFAGLGYGIINATSIGLTVDNANIQDCRHAYTGAFTVDVTLNGGSYSRVIDDHWTNRFVANNVKVYAIAGSSAFEFAGNDVTLNNPVASGGRSLLGIRVDTPSLGGKVIINNPTVYTRGEASFYFFFGFSSPNGITAPGFTYTNKPVLPDYVEINNVKINTETPIVYGAFLGSLPAPHTAWGTIALKGNWTLSGNVFIGVFGFKDSNFQQDRRPHIIIDGDMDFGVGGTAAYIIASDTSSAGAFDITIKNIKSGSVSYSGYSCNTLFVSNSGIRNVTNNNTSATPTGFYKYDNCTFQGGTFSPGFKNHLLNSCVFSSNYSSFPVAADISLNSCVRVEGVSGLPSDIRNNIVSPFTV